jgi:hypothetical protein
LCNALKVIRFSGAGVTQRLVILQLASKAMVELGMQKDMAVLVRKRRSV